MKIMASLAFMGLHNMPHSILDPKYQTVYISNTIITRIAPLLIL